MSNLLPQPIPQSIEAAPCDGCRFTERCARQHLACESFSLYLDGRGSKLRWQNAPREPTRARYIALRLHEAA